MKKQKTDQQSADELLAQLQKSYLDDPDDQKSGSVKEDADDLAFRHRLAGLLKRFTGGKDSKKEPKRKKEKLPPPEPTVEEGSEPLMEETPAPVIEEPTPVAEESVAEEPIVEEKPKKAVKPKKEPKPKTEKPIPVAPEPIVEEEPERIVEEEPEPIVEEPAVEEEPEPIIEEVPEPMAEESEPIVETPAPIVEETPEPIVEEEPEPIVEEEPEPVAEIKPAPRMQDVKDAPPVVIRPKGAERSEQKPIVIKPRDEKQTDEEPSPDPASTEPIRIGKKPTAQPWGPPRVTARGGVSLPPIKFGKGKKRETAESERFMEKNTVKQPSTKLIAKKSLPNVTQPGAGKPSEVPISEPTATSVPSKKQPIIKLVQRKEASRPKERPADVTARESGLTENDVEMIFELGYENELGRVVGFDALKKIKSEHARHIRASQNTQYETAFGYRGEEYSGREMRDKVLAAYLHDRRNLILRLIGTVVCIFALFAADLPQWFGPLVGSAAASHPYLFAGTGAVLLCAAAGIHFRRMLSGWRGLLRFAPTPDAPIALLFPLILCYDIIRIFNAKGGRMPGLDLVFGCGLLLYLVCDCIRLGNEMRTFRLLSGEEEKTVLEPTDPGKKMMRQGNRTVKIINDEIAEQLYRVRLAKEAVGFFRRSNETSSIVRPVTLFLILSLSLSLIAGVVGAVLSENVQTALTAAALTFLLTLSGSVSLLFFTPLYAANRKLTAKGCALIGEESVDELSTPSTLIFEDTDLFTARRTAQASVRQSDDFKEDLRLCEILFRKIDGTLGPIGRAKSNGANDPPVLLLRIEDHGVEALVDGKTRILAGNGEFLSRYGLTVPAESTDRVLRRSPNTTLLYIAIDGVLKLHYEIAYQPDPKFEEIARLLSECEMTTAIHTYDPDLSDAFLQSVREPGAPLIRVIKPGRYEDPAPLDMSDTGAVSIAGSEALVAPVRAACAIRRLKKIGYRVLLASLLPGAALAVCGAVLLPASILPYLSLLAILWRGLWDLACIPLVAGFLKSDALFGDPGKTSTVID